MCGRVQGRLRVDACAWCTSHIIGHYMQACQCVCVLARECRTPYTSSHFVRHRHQRSTLFWSKCHNVRARHWCWQSSSANRTSSLTVTPRRAPSCSRCVRMLSRPALSSCPGACGLKRSTCTLWWLTVFTSRCGYGSRRGYPGPSAH